MNSAERIGRDGEDRAMYSALAWNTNWRYKLRRRARIAIEICWFSNDGWSSEISRELKLHEAHMQEASGVQDEFPIVFMERFIPINGTLSSYVS